MRAVGKLGFMAYQNRLLDSLLDELATDLPAILLVGPRAAGKRRRLSGGRRP